MAPVASVQLRETEVPDVTLTFQVREVPVWEPKLILYYVALARTQNHAGLEKAIVGGLTMELQRADRPV